MGQVKRLLMEAQEKGDWPIPEMAQKCVCTHHFEDPYLNGIIKKYGKKGRCTYCGKTGVVCDMYEFLQQVSWKIHLYYTDIDNAGFMLASSIYDDDKEVIPGVRRIHDYAVPVENKYYETKEEFLTDLELIPTSNEALDSDIRDSFSTEEWVSKDIYEEDRNIRFSNQWDKFVNSVTFHRRFTFLASPEFETLIKEPNTAKDDILSVLNNLIIEQGLCKNLAQGLTVYRARKVDNPNGIYAFDDITSPPDDKAFPNRMSPAGVSMFYASCEKNTAINECVGKESDTIIVGTFKTTKALRVIDLTAIPANSFWMKGWQENIFLHSFHENITKRIRPDDKNYLQYVPTQVFTEFLRYMFKDENGRNVDGLIYGSSKTAEKNIVLFCNQRESKNFVNLEQLEKFVSKTVWEKKEDSWKM